MTDEIEVGLGQIAAAIDILLNGTGKEIARPFVLILCDTDGPGTAPGATVMRATVLSNVAPKVVADILAGAATAEGARFNQ